MSQIICTLYRESPDIKIVRNREAMIAEAILTQHPIIAPTGKRLLAAGCPDSGFYYGGFEPERTSAASRFMA